MSRWRIMPFRIAPVLLSAAALYAQQKPPVQPPLPPEEDAPPAGQIKPQAPKTDQEKRPEQGVKPPSDSDLPPEEDAALTAGEKHSFNPVESKKSLQAGDFYFKKGNYRAAAERFRDATQWNEGNADAWLRLGEAEEKREQTKTARAAYEKYLQLAGNTKNAGEVKKRLEKLK